MLEIGFSVCSLFPFSTFYLGVTDKCVSHVKTQLDKVKVTQLCPTLCDPMDYTVLGILQARILEWVAFPFSRGSSQPMDQTQENFLTQKFQDFKL